MCNLFLYISKQFTCINLTIVSSIKAFNVILLWCKLQIKKQYVQYFPIFYPISPPQSNHCLNYQTHINMVQTTGEKLSMCNLFLYIKKQLTCIILTIVLNIKALYIIMVHTTDAKIACAIFSYIIAYSLIASF